MQAITNNSINSNKISLTKSCIPNSRQVSSQQLAFGNAMAGVANKLHIKINVGMLTPSCYNDSIAVVCSVKKSLLPIADSLKDISIWRTVRNSSHLPMNSRGIALSLGGFVKDAKATNLKNRLAEIKIIGQDVSNLIEKKKWNEAVELFEKNEAFIFPPRQIFASLKKLFTPKKPVEAFKQGYHKFHIYFYYDRGFVLDENLMADPSLAAKRFSPKTIVNSVRDEVTSEIAKVQELLSNHYKVAKKEAFLQ